MTEWWPTIAAVLLGVPLSTHMRLNALGAGMLCAGLNILITLLVPK